MPKTIQKDNKLKSANFDLIVGIPSLNEADNISFVTEQVDAGLRKYFPGTRSLIVNVDNHSPDNTKRVFLGTHTVTPKKYVTTPSGVVGKGNNFNNLFLEVQRVNARAVLVVDADLKSITPDWVKKMLMPVLEGIDYVLPLYSRNEYDGTITNLVCFPILYGLLGYNIRQPIAGDFAFSRALNDYWLEQKWQYTTCQFGIDIFMTLHAIFGGFKLGQVYLGSKVHKPSAPKLNVMFAEVITTLFKTILNKKEFWMNTRAIHAIPLINKGTVMHPQGMPIDYKSIKATALREYKKCYNLIKLYLSPQLFALVDKYVRQNKMKVNKRMWQRIVFDILVAYDKSGYKSDVINAFKALYFVRVASYIHYTLDLDYRESEKAILELAQLFRQNKHKFISAIK